MIAAMASTAPTTLVHLSAVDLVIIAFYFALVLGIGFYLKRFAKTGEDFFLAGREMTAWVAGLAFPPTNTAFSPRTGIGSARFPPWFFWAS